jgi:methylenetetrahydrofolate dehydrogenase (NADP+) / methenyltetrahydrofolate cyclohydrolase
MTSQCLAGAAVRDAVFDDLRARTAATGLRPGLAVILVGDDPASQVYVRSKGKACEALGFHHVTHRLPAGTPESELLDLVARLNRDPEIHGILVQVPLPPPLSAARIQGAVDPEKDVDGFHPVNLGRLLAGTPGIVPCTPLGVSVLLAHYGIGVAGRHVAVVGRSVIVGRPLAMLLSRKGDGGDATVTLCHSRTPELARLTSGCEIVVAALGVPGFLDRRHIARGAVVVDVGINRVADPASDKGHRLAGDVAPEAMDGWASAYTPVPGGIGLMTIAMLMRNTFEAAARRAALA